VGYYNTNAQIDAAIARRCKLEKRGGGDEPLDSDWPASDTNWLTAHNHHSHIVESHTQSGVQVSSERDDVR